MPINSSHVTLLQRVVLTVRPLYRNAELGKFAKSSSKGWYKEMFIMLEEDGVLPSEAIRLIRSNYEAICQYIWINEPD